MPESTRRQKNYLDYYEGGIDFLGNMELKRSLSNFFYYRNRLLKEMERHMDPGISCEPDRKWQGEGIYDLRGQYWILKLIYVCWKNIFEEQASDHPMFAYLSL